MLAILHRHIPWYKYYYSVLGVRQEVVVRPSIPKMGRRLYKGQVVRMLCNVDADCAAQDDHDHGLDIKLQLNNTTAHDNEAYEA